MTTEPSTLKAKFAPAVPMKCPLCLHDQVPASPVMGSARQIRATTPPLPMALLTGRPASADARPSFSSFSLSLGACRGRSSYVVRSPGPYLVATPRSGVTTSETRPTSSQAQQTQAQGFLQDAWAQLSMLAYDEPTRIPDPQRLRRGTQPWYDSHKKSDLQVVGICGESDGRPYAAAYLPSAHRGAAGCNF
eukprot:symbB.v1.2.026526.t1/scaffold2656.1/size73803/4